MLENPNKPFSVEEFLEITKKLRNIYWNQRPESEIIPKWEIEDFKL